MIQEREHFSIFKSITKGEINEVCRGKEGSYRDRLSKLIRQNLSFQLASEILAKASGFFLAIGH